MEFPETTKLLFCQRLGHSSENYIANEIPVNTIRAETQRLLYHQRLAHASDECAYTAYKYIYGIPQFPHRDKLFDTCPACITGKYLKIQQLVQP